MLIPIVLNFLCMGCSNLYYMAKLPQQLALALDPQFISDLYISA